MMDRDFPIGRREAKITVVCLVIGGIVGALLFGGYLPGLHPQLSEPKYIELNGEQYVWTTLGVPSPIFGFNFTKAVNVSFANVTFFLWVTHYDGFDNQTLDGNATLSNGTVYSFALESRPDPSDRVTQYIAPGGAVAVEWNDTLNAYLLVHASA